MSWTPLDLHAHSQFSDGALPAAEVVDIVRARGVRPSLADHATRDIAKALRSAEAIREYLDALDSLGVYRGAEFCWQDDLWRELPTSLTARFTHRLGSLHAVRLPDGQYVGAFTRTVPAGLALRAYMDALCDSAESLAREMPVDILAHPTLVALPYREIPAEELWTERHEERLVNALASAGICFEISNRYPPHERLVRRALAAGLRLSLGSDGHTAEQVGNIEAPLALTRALGVPDESLYDPAVHGSRVSQPPRSVAA